MNNLVTLVNSPKVFFDLNDRTTEFGVDNAYPVGLLLISSAIKNTNAYDVQYIDANFFHLSVEVLVLKIVARKPGFVGMNVTFPNMLVVEAIANKVKQLLPETIVVVGGPAATLANWHILNHSATDFVVMGEGEETIVELLHTLSAGGDYTRVRGISYKNEVGLIVRTKTRLPIDIDSTPFVDVENIPQVILKESREITLFTSRGCQAACSFCSTPAIWGKGRKFLRSQSVDRIFAEIDNYETSGFEFDSVHFLDDSFTNDWDNVVEFARRFQMRYLTRGKTWRCLSRVRAINTREKLLTLVESGCKQVSVGVESASQKILTRIGKGLNIEQVNEFFSSSRGLPIKKNGFFMIGFPDETEENIQQTIDFMETCEFDNIAINIVMAYPGTRLYKQVYGDEMLIIPEFGGIDFNQDLTDETVERIKKYSITPKVSLSEHVDIERLHALKEIAYNKFYQNKNKNRLLCSV